MFLPENLIIKFNGYQALSPCAPFPPFSTAELITILLDLLLELILIQLRNELTSLMGLGKT